MTKTEDRKIHLATLDAILEAELKRIDRERDLAEDDSVQYQVLFGQAAILGYVQALIAQAAQAN